MGPPTSSFWLPTVATVTLTVSTIALRMSWTRLARAARDREDRGPPGPPHLPSQGAHSRDRVGDLIDGPRVHAPYFFPHQRDPAATAAARLSRLPPRR